MIEKDLSSYRDNVGVVLFNREGQVWLGRRARAEAPFNWQFPQGGVDRGEHDWETAARRELREETGVTSVTLLGRTEDWIIYDFPAGYGGSKAARGFKGQKQKWFAYRFEGQDCEVDLEAHHEVEFEAWKWADFESALDTIVPFKREAYRAVIAAFRTLAEGLHGPR